MPESAPPQEQTLTAIAEGQTVCVSRIEANVEDTVRLKRLGIHPGRQLRVLQAGDPLILRVLQSRLGLSRQLAARVFVRVPVIPPAGHP